MGKNPAFQFYVKDWLSDPQLKMASHSTKGIWIDLLCYMWESSTRGELSGTRCQIKKLIGAEEVDFDLFVKEAQALLFCDIVTDDNAKVTVRNRRMYREVLYNDSNRIRQARHREKLKSNAKITPSSPSPSPSPTPKIKRKKNILLSFEDGKIELDDKKIAFAKSKGHNNGTLESLFNAFKDHHLAKGSRFVDWDAAWRKWVNNDIKFNGSPAKSGISTSSKQADARSCYMRCHGNCAALWAKYKTSVNEQCHWCTKFDAQRGEMNAL